MSGPIRRGAPRFLLVGGKGGVGKTTWAAAQALAAADAGRRVLLVSTDPAHSLGDALRRPLGRAPRAVATRRGRLHAVELDADRALARWLARHRRHLATIAERGTYLDEDDVARLLRLSFPGVDELMGLMELARLAGTRAHDDIVVDTAPTGHTLRLLAMPDTLRRIAGVLDAMHAKHRFLAGSLGAGYTPDAADALIARLDADGAALQDLLRDPRRAVVAWLTLPEPMALAETDDALRALAGAGLAVRELVVNRVITTRDPGCAACRARAAQERRALGVARRLAGERPVRVVPLQRDEPRGLRGLRAVTRSARSAPGSGRAGGPAPRARRAGSARGRGVPGWLEAAVPAGVRLLAFVGKGGVGKTTSAAATALLLAAHRHPRVLLLSTDPAHSLADVLDAPVGNEEVGIPGAPPGLRARELDAARELERRRARYRAAVDRLFDALLRGSRLDVAYDRQVVQSLMDLAPPGLDEVFAVLSVTEALLERHPEPYDLVVVDTAPTGHALRLLAMPRQALEWVHAVLAILLRYREVLGLGDFAADLLGTARSLRQLAAWLRDGERCRAVVVTRDGELPALESARLLARLRRLAVPVGAVVVNAVGCACARRGREEARAVGRLRPLAGRRPVLVAPAAVPPPHGVGDLLDWGRQWRPAS
jgi:arsenite-transporting ATPase